MQIDPKYVLAAYSRGFLTPFLSLVVTAFVGTVVVFTCFAASAIYAKRRTFLFMGTSFFGDVSMSFAVPSVSSYTPLGGYLLSCLSNLVLLVFVGFFFRLPVIELIWLYGGLFLFCGFVLYDTNCTSPYYYYCCVCALNLWSVIIEKAHQGSRDFVRHALELFLGTQLEDSVEEVVTHQHLDFVNIFVRILIILSRRRN